MKQLIVFLSHETSIFALAQFQKLANDLGEDDYDFTYLFNNVMLSKEQMNVPKCIERYVYVQDKSQLEDIENYKFDLFMSLSDFRKRVQRNSRYFCPNYAIFLYLHNIDYSKYDYIYFIEYDVYFNGDWKTIFDDLNNNLLEYDFLTTNICTYNEHQRWNWWRRGNKKLLEHDLSYYVKCLNNFCRFSNKAIKSLLNAYYSGQYICFYEIFWPTYLLKNGFKIGDIGDNRTYTINGYEHKYYSTSHFSYDPVIDFKTITLYNKLYHPVKNYE